LPAGFSAYQWRKNGVVITGATTNTLQVNQFGTYDARVQRGGIWSDWSRTPVQVKAKDPFTTIPAKIEAEAWAAMSGVQTENTSDAEGGLNVGYIDIGDWMDYKIKVPAAGVFTVKLRLASAFSASQLQIRRSDGSVLSTVNVPNTGNWQSWQTVYITVNLPVGDQTLRVISTAGAWNFNWLEFVQGIVNQPPTADAGPNQSISLPVNSVSLNGLATDADGTIASSVWSKIYGPAEGTITTARCSNYCHRLIEATYVFRLTVTDNSGAVMFDDVTYTVNPLHPHRRIQD
jgi:hypothetical protein